MDDYKLLPQFLIDALNKKRALNPAEASMAGKYADPANQIGIGDIASSLDPVSAGVRGYNQLSGMNPQDFAKSALLMQSGALPFLPKDMRNQYVNTALQGITGAADIFPATVIGGASAKAGAKEIARQIETGTGLFGRNVIDPRMYMIKTPTGRIPTNYSDTKKLSEMLERAATQKGYNVTLDSSRVSPSTYVTLSKQIDNAPEYQIRLSNHQDKYPSQAPVGLDQTRFSVDPSPMSHGTFEEAIMFLENKGFPTKLSTKYKNQQDKIIKEKKLVKQPSQDVVPTYKDINVTRSDSGKTFFVKGLLGEKISVDKNAIPLELRQSQDKTALNEFLRNKLFSQ